MELLIPDKFFNKEELTNTPKRYKKFLKEWLEESNNFKFTTFDKPQNLDQMIIVKDISFYSMCSHHLLPFVGKCHIAYLPGDKIAGLSKFPRVVDKYAHRPQLQERLTQQIADYLQKQLQPLGLMVIMEAEHMCMSMRGIKKQGSKTVTSAIKGMFIHNNIKSEFMELIK
jgi:GTP cyclohydrolase I|tara:strand:- start:8264 stop:8773 length:510 start_codon:yes stop_codon:yes gene_type:complete